MGLIFFCIEKKIIMARHAKMFIIGGGVWGAGARPISDNAHN